MINGGVQGAAGASPVLLPRTDLGGGLGGMQGVAVAQPEGVRPSDLGEEPGVRGDNQSMIPSFCPGFGSALSRVYRLVTLLCSIWPNMGVF